MIVAENRISPMKRFSLLANVSQEATASHAGLTVVLSIPDGER